MNFRPSPVEWNITPESMYYPEQSMCTSDIPEHNKTAGITKRLANAAMSNTAMVTLGAVTRARDNMNHINNNTMNYSLGRTF